MQTIIEARMQEPPKARIGAKAKLQGSKIDVTVNMDGLPQDGRSRKLQIVLSEDSIRIPGMDAVRFQTNVVRKIVGDPVSNFGIPLALGAKATVKQTLDLDSIAAELKEVNSPAPGRDTFGHWDGYKWSEVPPEETWTINRKKLHVVAFVQDEATGEVLDVVSVKVK